MKLVILAAFPQELRHTLHGLRARRSSRTRPFPVYSTFYSSCEIHLVQTGIGITNAEAALKYILQGYSPDMVLSLGFGGALYSGAEIGDLIWPSRVFLIDDVLTETVMLSDAEKTANRISGRITIHEGNVLTLSRRMKKSGINSALFRELLFPVCDMETFPLAKIAVERQLPFFAIRSITDRFDEDIPPMLYNVADESGHYRLSRALIMLVRNPWLVPDSIKLGRNSMIASRNLWNAVRHIIDVL